MKKYLQKSHQLFDRRVKIQIFIKGLFEPSIFYNFLNCVKDSIPDGLILQKNVAIISAHKHNCTRSKVAVVIKSIIHKNTNMAKARS